MQTIWKIPPKFENTEIILAEDNTALAVDVGADATNDAIYVKVTGIAGHTYRWVALLTTVEAKE